MSYKSSKKTVLVPMMFLSGSSAAIDAKAANHVMTLNADGTFNSPTTSSNYVHINEGDSVTFEGLERTDGIVQTNPLPIGTSDVCTELFPKAYKAPGGIVDENEFTGPLRKGVSGIFALGPMSKPSETESFREYDLGQALAPGTNACAPGYGPKFTVFDPNDGHYYQLCRDNGTSNQTMSVTMENPDIDGIIIRMNWKDIETRQGTFDYVRLDDEMWALAAHQVTDWPRIHKKPCRAKPRKESLEMPITGGESNEADLEMAQGYRRVRSHGVSSAGFSVLLALSAFSLPIEASGQDLLPSQMEEEARGQESVASLLETGRKLLEATKYKEAAVVLERAVKLDPESLEARMAPLGNLAPLGGPHHFLEAPPAGSPCRGSDPPPTASTDDSRLEAAEAF